jgi:hypothetical protein
LFNRAFLRLFAGKQGGATSADRVPAVRVE